jgi:ornithine decarboxylase
MGETSELVQPLQTNRRVKDSKGVVSADQLSRFVELIQGRQIATPYMITDLETIRGKCKEFKKTFPDIQLFYAAKCFGDNEVIKAIDPLADGYDIASVAEIKKLLKLHIKPERMTFSNPVKSEKALKQANKLGVKRFAYQSANELLKIKKHVSDAEVYLRVKVPDQTSSITFSSKFGCELSEAKELLLLAQSLGLKPIGMTFHVGSQATVGKVWERAIGKCAEIMEDLRLSGIKLSLLNLGGGFPVRYSLADPTLQDAQEAITGGLAKAQLPKDIKVIAEPGRFLVADSSAIVTTIIGVEDRGDTTWLYLDVGTFQAFIEVFEFGYFPYPVYSVDHLTGRTQTKKLQKYVLTGPSCDSYDTMSFGVLLPSDLAVGSKLLIAVAGAYTIVYGSNFNGFKVPNRYFIGGKE